MKYDSLKRKSVKTFKVSKFDGGLNSTFSPMNIEDDQLSDCKNMWFKGGRLQTRPGLECSVSTAIQTPVLGSLGLNEYKIHNAKIDFKGEYNRIVTAEVLTDDYAYYINVFLVSESGHFKSIGKMSFFRTTSEIFYMPINVLFYTGKPQNGGGIFAMVTVQNSYYEDERYYNLFEISKDLTEWNRVYDFYIPTLYINGRGNKYQIAKSGNQVTTATPKILESPNMLNGRFHSYFTSDGYSNSFRLPFTDLSSDSIICRVYYTLRDYVEWQISGTSIVNTQKFFGQNVTMEVDREKGTVYFTSESGDYAIPAMDMYHENNIKITATKEIEKGIGKVLYSTCSLSYQSRIIVAGGENGNDVFVADYDTPLYFPQNSSVKVGSGDSEIVDLVQQNGKIVALKKDGIYTLTLKKGDKINDISLLADNDKYFTECDSFTCEEITKQIGCRGRNCTAVLNNSIIFLGGDSQIYALTSLSGKKIISLSQHFGKEFSDFKYADFGFSGNNHYMIFKNNKAFVGEVISPENIKWYYWEFPESFKISGGFWAQNKFSFLCTNKNTYISYIATLAGDSDNSIEYNDDGIITKYNESIQSYITTKHFDFSSFSSKKNIESIFLSIASKGNVSISVNGKEIADVNFRLTNEEYDKCEYKSVKLMPHLNNINTVYITLSSKNGMSVGELEIIYKKIG